MRKKEKARIWWGIFFLLVAGVIIFAGYHMFMKKDHEKEHWGECHYGAFSRTFYLPETVDTKKIKAKMKNGLLEITLPKQPKTKPKKITVHMN